MQRDNKYYKPDISEFHVGFEYMVELPDPNDIKSKKWFNKVFDTLTWFNDNTGISLAANIELGKVKVKYLDKADIEELGFVQSSYCQIEDDDDRLVDGFSIDFNKDNIELRYNKYKWKGETLRKLSILKKGVIVFRGNIKNKSELKRVLTMIGIDYEKKSLMKILKICTK